MSGKAARFGDFGTGHGCWPSRANIEGSGNVKVNGLGWHRVGDAWAIHCCVVFPFPCHASNLQEGAPTVYVNGRAAGRTDDLVACGSYVSTGSQNVYVGDA